MRLIATLLCWIFLHTTLSGQIVLLRRKQVAAAGGGSVTFDAATTGRCGNGLASITDCASSLTTLTFAHTTGSGSNRAALIIVCVSGGSGTAQPAISSVTYAGNSTTVVTNLDHVPAAGNYYCSWYSQTNPTSGANNVVITVAAPGINTGNSIIAGGIFTASGVDQTTPVVSGAAASNSGSGTSATATLGTGASGDLSVYAACSGTSNTSTSTGTERFDSDQASGACNSLSGATASGTATSISWTVASDSWIMSGTKFKAN